MCLFKVDKKIGVKDRFKVRRGWKVLKLGERGNFVFYHKRYIQPVLAHKWMKSTTGRIRVSGWIRPLIDYPCGFHVYASRQAAEQFARRSHYAEIVSVEAKHIVATGYQENNRKGRTWVCKYMRLIDEPKKKKGE